MGRAIFLLLLAVVISSCDSGPRHGEPSGPPVTVAGTDVNLGEPTPQGPSCSDQIAAWQVQLADHRAGEDRRQKSCSDLAARQLAVNDRYRSLRNEWAFTASQIEICMHKGSEEERKSCVEGLCGFIALGGYRCSDLTTPLSSIVDEQDQIYTEGRQLCCTAVLHSEVQQALAYSEPEAPQCTLPRPPPAPSCAAGTGTAAEYLAGNGM
ncbi:MAG: hypothetical protein QOJ27_592 [Sphingomonadales bacterium]|nr:hypothetical protein [Sphingomonadales bacterium]